MSDPIVPFSRLKDQERGSQTSKFRHKTSGPVEGSNASSSKALGPTALGSPALAALAEICSYLHNCACIVLTRLVREFYAHLEVAQNEDNGIILPSTIARHVIMVDPQVISQNIGVPVLQSSASPINKVVVSPSLDDLKKFFHVVPQCEERSTTIRISALSPPHHLLMKIIQHNIWPIVRRSDLILKRAQFLYAIYLRLSFYLCKHIS
jgi:hypothetical protein